MKKTAPQDAQPQGTNPKANRSPKPDENPWEITPVDSIPSVVIKNRIVIHDAPTLAYLRQVGLPEDTDLEGAGFADISSITGAILSDEEIARLRALDVRYSEFENAVTAAFKLQRNPGRAKAALFGDAPIALSREQLLSVTSIDTRQIRAATKLAKSQLKEFFRQECLPEIIMVQERALEKLDSAISMRARDEMDIFNHQKSKFFKDDMSFRFQASAELRGLIKKRVYMQERTIHMQTSGYFVSPSTIKGALSGTFAFAQ